MGSLSLAIYQHTSGTFNIRSNLLYPAACINLQPATQPAACNLQITPSVDQLCYLQQKREILLYSQKHPFFQTVLALHKGFDLGFRLDKEHSKHAVIYVVINFRSKVSAVRSIFVA